MSAAPSREYWVRRRKLDSADADGRFNSEAVIIIAEALDRIADALEQHNKLEYPGTEEQAS